jgi:hypothetical protein
MDVNKTLMEERVRVFSDLGTVTDNVDNGAQREVLISEPGVADNTFLLSSMDLRGLVNEEFNSTELSSN